MPLTGPTLLANSFYRWTEGLQQLHWSSLKDVQWRSDRLMIRGCSTQSTKRAFIRHFTVMADLVVILLCRRVWKRVFAGVSLRSWHSETSSSSGNDREKKNLIHLYLHFSSSAYFLLQDFWFSLFLRGTAASWCWWRDVLLLAMAISAGISEPLAIATGQIEAALLRVTWLEGLLAI